MSNDSHTATQELQDTGHPGRFKSGGDSGGGGGGGLGGLGGGDGDGGLGGGGGGRGGDGGGDGNFGTQSSGPKAPASRVVVPTGQKEHSVVSANPTLYLPTSQAMQLVAPPWIRKGK